MAKVKTRKQKKPAQNAKKFANLRDAASHCGCTAPTLRNYISRYPDLPIHSRGVGREGWELDIEALDFWRQKTGLLNWNPRLPGDEATRNTLKHSDRKSKFQADLLELQVQEKMGQLVDRQAMVSHLSTKVAQLAKRLDLLPSMMAKKLNLSGDLTEEIRKYLDEARHALVRDDAGFWGEA